MADELIVLGSSSGTPTRRRFASAYALTVTGKLFLIDCGAPVTTLLYRYNLDPLDVQSVLLSHWHVDHVANLGLFISQNHQLKRLKSLKIYGPRGTRAKIDRLLNDTFLLPDELSYKLKITNVKPDRLYREALLRINYFKTQHLEKPKHKTRFGKKAVSCGMVLRGPGWRVVYSGDLSSPYELSAHVKGCDLLIHEMAHHKPETVAEFAEAAKIPHVLVSHIGTEFDSSPEKIVAAFKGRYHGDLIVAEDGTKIQLNNIRKADTIEIKPDRAAKQETQPAVHPVPAPIPGNQEQNGPGATFLQALTDLNLSPDVIHQIQKAAKTTIPANDPIPSNAVKSGQVQTTVTAQHPSTGTPDENRVNVILTIDAGIEDTELKDKAGSGGLRHHRILRIQQEALDQGGVLTQKELARLLNVSTRTIRRDVSALKNEGHQF